MNSPITAPALSRAIGALAFLAAFLIFSAEPLAGKQLLPQFGGTSAVWSVALIFFMTVVPLGYWYAHLLLRLSTKAQRIVHGGLLCAGALALLAGALAWNAPLLPQRTELLEPLPLPLEIIALLTLGFGVPFIALAATGIICHAWYARLSPGESPYFLYQLSNAGSFAGLLLYPLLIEPLLSLPTQGFMWMAAFGMGVLGLSFVALWRVPPASGPPRRGEAPGLVRLGAWGAYAAIPAALLVSSTAEITEGIAPVPFLWAAPLCAYLLSYIVAWSSVSLRPFAEIAVAGAAVFLFAGGALHFSVHIVAAVVLVFAAGALLHRRIYDTRPDPSYADRMYLAAGIGGAAGGAAVTFGAPLIFDSTAEFGLIAAAVAAVAVLSLAAESRRFAERMSVAAVAALIFAIGMIASYAEHYRHGELRYADRNFFGSASVTDVAYPDTGVHRFLLNGAIAHGSQHLREDLQFVPTTYYATSTGIGRMMGHLRERDGPVSVGVIGLGVGMMGAYCRPGDRFVFFEIDPKIIEIAERYFTYLSYCKDTVIVEEDGRLALQSGSESDARYDFLAVDAFTDDAIPVHLLTKEAFALYAQRITDAGVIGIHVSNQYLELAQVAFAAAEANGFVGVWLEVPAQGTFQYGTKWAFFARDGASLAHLSPFASDPGSRRTLWSDDWSNLLSVLRW